MKQVVLGPTFELELGMDADAASDRFTQAADGAREKYRTRRSGRHFLVTIAGDARHFWSPWLSLEFTARGADDVATTCAAFGRFNPSPAIWTGVMLASLSCLTLALGGLMWATAEWMLDRPPMALWASAFSGIGLIALYVVSLVGQRLAFAQMREIESWVREVLATPAAAG